jgi:peptidyl-prolyl cis-trans isomerase D
MIASIRRLSKTAIGTFIMAIFLLAILAGFAMQDIKSVISGGGFGLSSGTLAKVGGEEITDRELSNAMQRRLTEVRQQNPAADYSALAKDFDPLLTSLIQDAAVSAFAVKQDMVLSKRLVDAEIAKIPATRGLDGKFSDQAYAVFLQQQRLTDPELRKLLSNALLERMVLAPAAANARIPVGMATPYASMLMEAREADVALVPIGLFANAIPDPSDADLQAYYRANSRRYLVPEQRVLNIARIGPEQVAGLAASDKEIADYYAANQTTYGGKTTRVLSQAVVPTKAAADAIIARSKTGASFVDATKPAGLSAADISVGPQSREDFAKLAGDKVAAAAFGAASGAVVGPIQSDLGWHVVKVDAIRTEAGQSLASVKTVIAARLTSDKRKNALAYLVTKVENAVADGSSYSQAAKAAGLSVSKTPLITANGTSKTQPEFKLPADLAPALRSGFDLMPDDDPVVETLPGDAGYAFVGVDQIAPAAAAPLATIKAQVAADWKAKQARDKARVVAAAVAAKVAKGMDLKSAMATSGPGLPPPGHAGLRRIQLAQMGGKVPPALGLMFSLSQGGSRMIPDPNGRGFVIVKVTKIVPGNAMLQPQLVARTQSEFQEAASAEYAEQFNKAIQVELGVKRNEEAIAAARKRIIGGGS